MNDKKYIYVVFVKALTALGKIGRKINKYEYTHISVCLDKKFERFATFSRKRHFSPFQAGFMFEKREHYAFGKNKKVKIKVFKVPVTKECMEDMENFIHTVEKDPEYVFNLYSMITMPFLHGFPIYKSYNCMSFVAKIFQLSGAVCLEKPYYKYNIEEMENLVKEYFYKEGNLNKKQDDLDYMKKITLWENMKDFFIINQKLIYRLLFMRNRTYE